MIRLVYSPPWFYGKDILIDIVSVVALLLIGFFAMRYYSLSDKNKNHLVFSISFFMLALSFLFKIATNFTLYYMDTETRKIGPYILSYHELEASSLPFYWGSILSRLLMLLGLYVLYCIYTKQEKSTVVLVTSLLLVTVYYGISVYHLFHLTSFVILALITYHYYTSYKTTKRVLTKALAYSFGIISISQLVFVFMNLLPTMYVAAEIIQLLGYLGLLGTFIMVLIHGKETKQN
ncbi:hypothetical protein HZB01_02420 [Candidatus Woesearchaeota archaeon]|nr:hypothetical protein [Candidatus Woesearchaeota archaeon]